jgi:hypothetical protein
VAFLDNILIEGLWRSLKHGCVYLHAWETGLLSRARDERWITFYNHQRPLAPVAVNRTCWSPSTQSKPIGRRGGSLAWSENCPRTGEWLKQPIAVLPKDSLADPVVNSRQG